MNGNKTTGQRIEALRKKRGLTQKELADLINIQRNKLSYYETDERTPTVSDLIELSKALETTTDFLLCITDVESNNTTIRQICDYTKLNEQAIKDIHNFFECLTNGIIHPDEESFFIENFSELLSIIVSCPQFFYTITDCKIKMHRLLMREQQFKTFLQSENYKTDLIPERLFLTEAITAHAENFYNMQYEEYLNYNTNIFLAAEQVKQFVDQYVKSTQNEFEKLFKENQNIFEKLPKDTINLILKSKDNYFNNILGDNNVND